MANSIILPLLLLLLALASSTFARPGPPFHPCKTLLISTYSVSFQPRHLDPHHPHPRPDFIAVVAEVRSFRPEFVPENPQFRLQDETLIPHPRHHRHHPDLPLGSATSFGDRTLDILNVLASLLFGAACGALTAGTMYIIWSLFTTRFESYQSLDDFTDDEDDDDDDDIFNPKKPLNNITATPTPTKSADETVVVVAAVPAPSSSTDSAATALLNKESA